MSAYEDIVNTLNEGEEVKGIVFGPWGWGSERDIEKGVPGYGEPDDPPVPYNMRGVLLTLEEAAPFMGSWSFFGGFGAPSCYATYIWTNQRVFWVTQYDGATGLDSMPITPRDCMPEMPGGG